MSLGGSLAEMPKLLRVGPARHAAMMWAFMFAMLGRVAKKETPDIAMP